LKREVGKGRHKLRQGEKKGRFRQWQFGGEKEEGKMELKGELSFPALISSKSGDTTTGCPPRREITGKGGSSLDKH